jgi:hypothetical protein
MLAWPRVDPGDADGVFPVGGAIVVVVEPDAVVGAGAVAGCGAGAEPDVGVAVGP